MAQTSSSPSSIEINSTSEFAYSSDDLSDSSNLVITCHRLNDNNYLEWSQSMKIFLNGRERLGYITDENERPCIGAPSFAKWWRENNQVMT
ncbi:hypothetical protein GQ457_06G016430 [Hibiscus cannabinus]